MKLCWLCLINTINWDRKSWNTWICLPWNISLKKLLVKLWFPFTSIRFKPLYVKGKLMFKPCLSSFKLIILKYLRSSSLTNLRLINKTYEKNVWNIYLSYFHLDIFRNKMWFIWMFLALSLKTIRKTLLYSKYSTSITS